MDVTYPALLSLRKKSVQERPRTMYVISIYHNVPTKSLKVKLI